jgi:hypothetical protein
MSELAKAAYDAYGDKTGWKNFRGDPMPKWEDLPEAIREAWRAATDAVVAIVAPQ